MFLHFKRPEYMVEGTAAEAWAGGPMRPPFYRTQPLEHHRLLMKLEETGSPVFYVVPQLYRRYKFNDAAEERRLIESSRFIRPLEIGAFPDAEKHYIAFRPEEKEFFVFSPPKRIQGSMEGRKLARYMRAKIHDGGQTALTQEALEKLTQQMLQPLGVGRREGLGPLEQVAYIAQTFYQAQMFVVSERENPAM
jgi:hypothetical protein